MQYKITRNDMNTVEETLNQMALEGWKVTSHNVHFSATVDYGMHYLAERHVILWEQEVQSDHGADQSPDLRTPLAAGR